MKMATILISSLHLEPDHLHKTFPDIDKNLLQYNGVLVWDDPFDQTNLISSERSELIIPLTTSGTNKLVPQPSKNGLMFTSSIHL
jgi:hypothetical protein